MNKSTHRRQTARPKEDKKKPRTKAQMTTTPRKNIHTKKRVTRQQKSLTPSQHPQSLAQSLTHLNHPRPALTATFRAQFSGCASSTCCGGSCGTGPGDENADPDDAPSNPPAGKKTVCDPHGLDGKPLALDQVELLVEFALDNRWTYSTITNQLSRTFTFSKAKLPQLVAPFPGAPSGPCHDQGAAFTFLQAINNIATNNNHWPYHLEIVPRKPQVIVNLKTVGRPGITNADVALAAKIDAFFDTNMTAPKAQNNLGAV